MNKFLTGLLIAGLLFIFYGNFFGIDLADEGLAALGYSAKQELGINFTHYQLIFQKIYPNGLDFIFARQLRWSLIIIASALLLLSIYKSRFKKHFNLIFLIIGATTLLSLSSNIRILTYSSLNQFIITLYAACVVQYIDKLSSPRSILWIIIATALLSITYLIRFPSFIIYLLLQTSFLIFIARKKLIPNLFASAFALAISLIILGILIVPINKVASDVLIYQQHTSQVKNGHGFYLITHYLVDFIRELSVLAFSVITLIVINRLKFSKITSITLKALSILAILIIIATSEPVSISRVVIFSFFLIIINYLGQYKNAVWPKIKTIIVPILFFPALAIASTLGSNISIINLLLLYSSIWMTGYIFLPENNKGLLTYISYLLIITALLKALYTGFFDTDHMRGSLISGFKEYKIQNRSLYLDNTIHNLVEKTRQVLELNNVYGREMIAINNTVGLAYLLDSNMPGSMNFDASYGNIYCLNLQPKTDIPVIISFSKVPPEFENCLYQKGIKLQEDYKLEKIINSAESAYRVSDLFIYIKK